MKFKYSIKNIIPIIFISFGASLLTIKQPCAEESNEFNEDLFFSEPPLITDASRFTQKQNDSTVATSIIDQEMIEASGAINIVDLLRLVPGFQASHVDGGNFLATYHGLANENPFRLEVRINGFTVNNQFTDGTVWQTLGIEIEDIDHIEITRGSNSSNFGFNSLIASINIITKSPLKEQGTQLRALAGSVDTQGYLLRHAGNLGSVYFRGGIDYKKSSGFDAIDDDTDIYQASFKSYYAPTFQDEIEYEFTYHTGLNTFVDFEEGIPGSNRRNKTMRHSLSWDHNYSGKDRLQVLASYDQYISKSDDILVSQNPLFPLVSRIGEIEANRFDIEISAFNKLNNSIDWLLGGGVRHSNIDGETVLQGNQDSVSRTSFRLFSGINWKITRSLILETSALFFDSNIDKFSISPRMGINYKLSPNHILRSSIAYSERSPGLLTQHQFSQDPNNNFIFTAADPNLTNEKLTSVDLGYRGIFFNSVVTSDFRLFFESLRDGIGATRFDPNNFGQASGEITDNSLDANTYGIETEIKYRITPETFIHLNYGYANSDGAFLENNVTNNIESIDKRTPKHTLAILGSHKFNQGFYASSAYYYQSELQWFGNDQRTASYDRLDLRFGKNSNLYGKKFNIELLFQNLLDDYIEHRVGNVFDTRAFIRLQLEL